MFGRKNDLLEHRVQQLEKEVGDLNNRFAIKLVERVVFAFAGAILMGVMMAAINGNLSSFIGG